MPKQQATQHRPKREDQRAKEVSDLKRENHELKRAVKRLQKEVTKRVSVEEDVAEQGLQEQAEMVVNKHGCPDCGTTVRELVLAGKQFHICPDCKWRAKVG
jgi:formamidopyrimidine-DNA glycosylase